MKIFYQGLLLCTLLFGLGVAGLGIVLFGGFVLFNFASIGNAQQRCGTHDAKHEIKMTKLSQVLHSLLRCTESLQVISLPTSPTSPSPAATFPKKRLRHA